MGSAVVRKICAACIGSLICAVVSGQTMDYQPPRYSYSPFGEEENQNLTGEHRSLLTETERTDEFTFYFR